MIKLEIRLTLNSNTEVPHNMRRHIRMIRIGRRNIMKVSMKILIISTDLNNQRNIKVATIIVQNSSMNKVLKMRRKEMSSTKVKEDLITIALIKKNSESFKNN